MLIDSLIRLVFNCPAKMGRLRITRWKKVEKRSKLAKRLQIQMVSKWRLPVELIAEVAHWLPDNECAELGPVSMKFHSFTNARALDWIAAEKRKVSIKLDNSVLLLHDF